MGESSVVGTAIGGSLVVALLAAGLAGCSSQVVPVAEKPASVTSTTSPSATGVKAFHSVRTYQQVALPVRLRIPAQHINSLLQRLGLAADGTIAAPSGWQVAGWYDQGPRPGQQGRAVIVGHVDSRSGPAVFFDLTRLRPGDAVYVDRADGSTARFRVTGRRQVPKDRFPAEAVYSPTLQASLMLMTCGGSFDHSTGHYRDNLIIFAVPE